MVETAPASPGSTAPTSGRDPLVAAIAEAAAHLLAGGGPLTPEVLAPLAVATGARRLFVVEDATGDVVCGWEDPGAASGDGTSTELPLALEGAAWGRIVVEDPAPERIWSEAEQGAFRTVGSIVAAARHRELADRRREAAEERYRELVERIPGVTYLDVPADDGVHMTFVSPQIEDVLGFSAQRFMDDPALWGQLIDPDDRARLEAIDAFDPENLAPFDHEYRMHAADGRTVWVHDTSAAIYDADGRVDHFLGFMTDVTERRRAEEDRAQAEQRFRAIVEHTPAITYQEPYSEPPYDAASLYLYVSPQVESIMGYTADEWIASGFWLTRIHPDDRAAVLEESERTARTGEPYRQDYRMIARDGRVLWFHDEAVLIHDEDGAPLFWQGVMVDISEQKEAEQQLRAAQERYRVLVEHVPAVVYAEGIVPTPEAFYVSPQSEAVFGYGIEAWREDPDFWAQHIHPEDRAYVLELDDQTAESGEPFHAEYRFRASDGTYRWVHDEAVRVLDEEGAPLFWQGVMVDLSAQREAQQSLRAAESRFRALVEHLPAVVYTESPDADPGKFYISPQVEGLFGYSADEWTWTPDFWIDHVHPDDREATLARDVESDRTRQPYAGEFRFLTADGRWLWIHDEATFVREPGGEGFWQGFMLDITARKEAEDQLRNAELKFRTIVEQSQAVFYTQELDPDDPSISITTYIAPGNTEMVGYSLEDIQADPSLWRKILHPDDRERVLAADAEANRGAEGRFSMEYRMIAKDGRIVWLQDEATVVRLPGQPPYWQGFLLDVTERKEAEAQLERALAVEREATQRLRALDEMKNTFLQAVSHDLRTPLAAILGLAITLERGDVQLAEADARDLAGRIAGNARRLDRLVMNLLDLDRLARGIVAPKLQPTDVAALVQRVLEESQLVPQERLHADLQPVTLPLDAAKVERIVENLLANAVRHAPGGTTVWVVVHPHPEGAEIVVEDDGAGIPPALRETVFEPFRQGPDAPQHSPGVGVGLTLVRRFAELHGGRAWVQERDGGGASFRVVLPAEPPAQTTSHAATTG